jgi:hypothetical protein
MACNRRKAEFEAAEARVNQVRLLLEASKQRLSQVNRLLEASQQRVDYDTLLLESSQESMWAAQSYLTIAQRGLEKIQSHSDSKSNGEIATCDSELEVQGSGSHDMVEGASDV